MWGGNRDYSTGGLKSMTSICKGQCMEVQCESALPSARSLTLKVDNEHKSLGNLINTHFPKAEGKDEWMHWVSHLCI